MNINTMEGTRKINIVILSLVMLYSLKGGLGLVVIMHLDFKQGRQMTNRRDYKDKMSCVLNDGGEREGKKNLSKRSSSKTLKQMQR